MHVPEISKNKDEWFTPRYAVKPILKYLKPNSRILCPFDTADSRFYQECVKAGHKVVCSHIATGHDFLKLNIKPGAVDYIISNPPYSIKIEVLQKLFSMKIPFAMLMSCPGVFEGERFDLFSKNDFELLVFKNRINFFTDYSKPEGSTLTGVPFSTWYFCSGILPKQITFDKFDKKDGI